MSKTVFVVTRTTGYSYESETEVVAVFAEQADAESLVEKHEELIAKRTAYLDEMNRYYRVWLKVDPRPILDCQKPEAERSGTPTRGMIKRVDFTPPGYYPVSEQDSKNNDEHYARWVEARNAYMAQSMPEIHVMFLAEGDGFDNPDSYEVVPVPLYETGENVPS